MATSGTGDLNAWNGTYNITLHFSWTRDANGVVSWSVIIPKIDDTFSPCWTNFYIRGGKGSSASGNLTGDLTSYCSTCTQCASYYQGHILWDQTQSGTINMGSEGGTLRLGFFGTRNGGNTEENYLSWGVDPTTWTARLYYDANGGTGAPEREKHEGISPSTSSYNFTVSSVAPTKTDARFEGWATSSSASTPTIFAGDTYTVQKSNPGPTIYAVWTDMKHYILSYNANGGSGAPAADTYDSLDDTTHTFTVSSDVPTRTDYSFLGWAESASATVPTIFAGDTITLTYPNITKTLYAVWVPDYRPGARRVSGAWMSVNRTGGKCHILENDVWKEMRTDSPGSTGNPPSRRAEAQWKNQYKIGSS